VALYSVIGYVKKRPSLYMVALKKFSLITMVRLAENGAIAYGPLKHMEKFAFAVDIMRMSAC
jgi:hypothetical protein